MLSKAKSAVALREGGKKIKLILASLVIIGAVLLVAGSTPPAKKAKADLSHTQIFPHIKVMMIDYVGSAANDPQVKEFMATHYDAAIGGGRDYSSYTSNPPPQFAYTNYYCTYVHNSGSWEYTDAKQWAEAHGVDFESFFIHYAEPTGACYGTTCYDLPAGSRVPSYSWYNSGGDLTKDGARIIFNPGNPNYRAWRLDYYERMFNKNPNINGLFIDNTVLNQVGVKSPGRGDGSLTYGGTFQEYQGQNPGTDYGNDLLIILKEFKEKFGNTKVQVPNVSNSSDSSTRIDLAYNCTDPACPYIWGIYRESTLQPHSNLGAWSPYTSIDSAEAAGVQNLMGGLAREERYTMPLLASYYLIKTNSTYFFPFLSYVADQWGIDPRQNQWFEAVTYNIGQPKNDPAGAQKFKTYYAGIDPSSPNKEVMNVTNVSCVGGTCTLTDPSKNWVAEQWKGKTVVFPSGYVKSNIYHSGSNWISLWAPAETPTVGECNLGDWSYSVQGREFDNALVLFKPYQNSGKTDDTTAAIETLPATADNPSGRYYILNPDKSLTGPVMTISLRNTDGAVLIKESALGRPNISKRVDKSSAQFGDTLTYTISYSNPTANTYTNAILEDPIPAGTTYVANSATGGGTFDGSKIIFNIGNLSPGVSGTVNFQVKIN